MKTLLLFTTSSIITILLLLFCSVASNHYIHHNNIMSVVEARTYYRGDGWTNFTLSPPAARSDLDPSFIFIPIDNRGSGTLLYTQSQKGGIYGAPISGYKYGANSPREYNIQINATRLTLDGYEDPLCPHWYTPPANRDESFLALNDPSKNQTVSSTKFHVLGNSLALDHRDRLTIYSDVMQMLVRFEATALQLEQTVANDPSHGSSSGSSSAVAGDFTISTLWGSWCNGTHFREVPTTNGVPASRTMSLLQFLESYQVQQPMFLPDGSVIFYTNSLQCIFRSGADINWMVEWWLGNCSANPYDTTLPTYAVPELRTVTACSNVHGMYVHRATNKVYFSEALGTVREVDLTTNMVKLVLGNTSRFVPYAPNCDVSTLCSPYQQQVFVGQGFAVVPAVTSEIDPSIKTTMLYVIDSSFAVVYAVDLVKEIMLTELVVSWNGGNPALYDNCFPVQITASFADVYVLCSILNSNPDINQVALRKRLLPFDRLPEPVVALPTVDAVSMTAITALTTLTSLGGFPTVAVTAGRARALIALARCDVTMNRNEALSWVESPIQLVTGNSDFRYVSGAVIGNMCIIILVPFIIHTILVRCVFARTKTKIENEMIRQLEADIAKFTSIGSINSNNGDDSEKEKNLLSPGTAALSLAAGIDVSKAAGGSGATTAAGGSSNSAAVSKHRDHQDHRILMETQARWRYPSASFVFALMFTIEPTVRCGAFLLRYADPSHPDNLKLAEDNPANLHTGWEFAVGIASLIVIFLGVAAIALFFAYGFTAVFYPIPTKLIDLDDSDDDDDANNDSSLKREAAPFIPIGGADDGSGGASSVEYKPEITAKLVLKQDNLTCMQKMKLILKLWYRKWKRFSKPYGEWRDHRNEQPRRFGGLIKPYVERGRWWSVAELLSAGGLAALAGFKTQETCTGTAIMSVIVLWLFFIGLIVVRPMASPVDQIVQSIVAGLSAFSGLFLLAAALPFDDNADFIHTSFSLAETLALAAAFIVGVQAFFDVGNRAFKILKFLFSNSCCGSSKKKNPPPPSPTVITKTKTKKDGNKKKKSPTNNEGGDNNNNGFSPIVIDTTPDSKGSNGTTQLAFSFDMPPEEGLAATGGRHQQHSSSGEGTGSSTNRTASSDMDLLDTVAKQIAKATKKQQQQYSILKSRSAMNLPPPSAAAAADNVRGSNSNSNTNSSNSAPSFINSVDATPHSGSRSQPQFLAPPDANALAAARVLLSASGMRGSGGSSGSASSMSTINNRSSMGSQQSSSDNSLLTGKNASPTPRQSINNSNANNNNNVVRDTTYKLDDDSSDSFSRQSSTDAMMGHGDDSKKKKERTMLMEYEILRAKLKHELDTGNNANDDDGLAGAAAAVGGGYSHNTDI